MSMTEGIQGIIEAGEKRIPEGYEKDGLVHCPECDTPRQTVITHPFTGEEKKVFCLCRCQAEKRDAEEARRKDEERRRRRERDRLGMFEDAECSSMTFAADDESDPSISRKMRNYAKRFETFRENGQGLLLFGDVGTGKTFYSACIANALFEEGYRILMTNFPDLVGRMQKDAFTVDWTKELLKYDLLIIDDLGVERDTGFMAEKVYSIIDARYRAKKPMVVSTNLTAQELKNPKDVMAARIYGRILERCYPVKFQGPDKRKQKADYKGMAALLDE